MLAQSYGEVTDKQVGYDTLPVALEICSDRIALV